MPTYVYKFIDSGETIEVQQSFSEDALTEAAHPGTGAILPVKKVYLPVGVTFKGGGFYKTDSRGGSKSSATAATTNGSKSGESNGSSSGSSDSSSSSTPAAAPATTAKPAAAAAAD